MALPVLKERTYSLTEYLEIEDSTDGRYEFYDCRIYLMSGTDRHSEIIENLSFSIGSQLRSKGPECRVTSGQLKLWISEAKIVYPDIMVYCEKKFYEKDGKVRRDILMNPVVVCEVLSPSTGSYDKREKQMYYLDLPSLKDYLIVSQTHISVQHFNKIEGSKWTVILYKKIEDTLQLESVGCEITLAEVYKGVEL